MCRAPFRQGVEEFGCGQCLPCRFNRRRLWTVRLLLEGQLHAVSLFATFTFSKEFYPRDGSLQVREVQLLLKRIRDRIAPSRIRYYAVGEYGDVTGRAHYHAVLFGLESPDILSACWPYGFVDVGELTEASAAYIAGYTVKKMTSKRDPRLDGRTPEFARMSLKPGIGAGAIGNLAQALVDPETGEVLSSEVPTSIRVNQSLWPLGRYLRGKLVEKVFTPAVQEHGRAVRALQSAVELRSVSARLEREERRLQVYRRAYADSIRFQKGDL